MHARLLIGAALGVALTAAATRAQRSPQIPAPGDPLPAVTIFDDQGKPFAMRDLRDHYSVVVFGCLT